MTISFRSLFPKRTRCFCFCRTCTAAVVKAALEQQQETLQFCERRCKAGLALAHELGDAANAERSLHRLCGLRSQAFTDYSVARPNRLWSGARKAPWKRFAQHRRKQPDSARQRFGRVSITACQRSFRQASFCDLCRVRTKFQSSIQQCTAHLQMCRCDVQSPREDRLKYHMVGAHGRIQEVVVRTNTIRRDRSYPVGIDVTASVPS